MQKWERLKQVAKDTLVGGIAGAVTGGVMGGLSYGAVNTLVRTDKGYKGYNTDILGLERELDEVGIKLGGNKVIILGAGGAARAIAFLCVNKGAVSVNILNRTVEKAQSIANDVNTHLNARLAKASVSRIVIERTLKLVTITVCTACKRN